MTDSASQAPFGGENPRRSLRERFVWHVGAAMGVSVLQQVLGLFRQILIAAYFGLSREYDTYLVANSMALMLVFNLSGVFDSIAVSRLAQIRDRSGDNAFWRASNRMLVQAIAAGFPFAGLFLATLWLAMPLIAAGFTPSERILLGHLGWYFIPWVVVAIPYYAMSAHLKAAWQFYWVFAAELLIILVSTFVLWVHHDGIFSLPVAYSSGYAVAALLLLMRRGLRAADSTSSRASFMGSMGKQYLAYQIGTATGFVERYYQSFLAVGGISALGYAGLIVNNLSSLLTFREIYVVPLSLEEGRSVRLERMLQGLVLLAVPCAVFIAAYAEPLVSVLLQRGKFTAEATALTASVLRIQAVSLLIPTVLIPLERVFQIVDRLLYTHIRYLIAFIGTIVFQSLFVFYLHLDVQGIAWAWLCNGLLILTVVIVLVRRCGVHLRWRGIVGNALLAGLASGVALALSWIIGMHFSGFVGLAFAATTYAGVLGLFALATRRHWRAIIG